MAESSSHAASREAMERILGSVVITNEIRRYNFHDALADDVVDEVQIIVLQSNLRVIPMLHEIGSHLLAKQCALGRIVHPDAGGVFIPDLLMIADILESILVRLQIIANDVWMRLREFFIRCDDDMRRSAAALMRLVLGAEIRQDTVPVLRECLDRFDGAEKRRVDI